MIHFEFFNDKIEVIEECILDKTIDLGVKRWVKRLLGFFSLDVLVTQLDFFDPD